MTNLFLNQFREMQHRLLNEKLTTQEYNMLARAAYSRYLDLQDILGKHEADFLIKAGLVKW